MIKIESMGDLRHLGIDLLTGEACAYSRRILCGLTQFGADLVCDFYGITSAGLREPWNSHACDERAVASFMLPRDLASNMDLSMVGLFKLGCVEVWEPRREYLTPGATEDGTEPRISYSERKAHAPREFESAGFLRGVESSDVGSDFYNTMTKTVTAGDGDFWLSDHIYLFRRYHNPGRSRNQHAMSGRVE